MKLLRSSGRFVHQSQVSDEAVEDTNALIQENQAEAIKNAREWTKLYAQPKQ